MSTVKNPESVKPVTGINQSPKGFQGLPFLFDRQNYLIMGVGLLIIIIGFMMMTGGRSADPNVFDEKAIYSFRRITLAPILVLIGLGVEVYAIMRRPAKSKS